MKQWVLPVSMVTMLSLQMLDSNMSRLPNSAGDWNGVAKVASLLEVRGLAHAHCCLPGCHAGHAVGSRPRWKMSHGCINSSSSRKSASDCDFDVALTLAS